MKVIDCPACLDADGDATGRLGDRECPYCDGDGCLTELDRLERLIGERRASRVRRPLNRVRRRTHWLRIRWAERHATIVASWVEAHRGIIDDEPRLRVLIQSELMRQLDEVTPLGWRRDDLTWCYVNARRALRGQPMLPLPYDVDTTVQLKEQNADFFIRNAVVLLAERRRRPKAGS